MRKLLLALLLIAAGAGALFYLRAPRQGAATNGPQPTTADSSPATQRPIEQVVSTSPEAANARTSPSGSLTQQVNAILADEASPARFAPGTGVTGLVESLSSTLPPGTVLENMRTSIRSYASTFGENPVGTNPEIARALAGDNPKQIVFLKDDGNRLNAKGELVDPWGTPYFFHQLSGTEMEIRSAGPDKKMWTADDLVIK